MNRPARRFDQETVGALWPVFLPAARARRKANPTSKIVGAAAQRYYEVTGHYPLKRRLPTDVAPSAGAVASLPLCNDDEL